MNVFICGFWFGCGFICAVLLVVLLVCVLQLTTKNGRAEVNKRLFEYWTTSLAKQDKQYSAILAIVDAIDEANESRRQRACPSV